MESEIQIIEKDLNQELEKVEKDYKEELIKDIDLLENNSRIEFIGDSGLNEAFEEKKDFDREEVIFESENKVDEEKPENLPNFKVVLNTVADKNGGCSNTLIQDSLKIWNDKKTIKINRMRLKQKAFEAEQMKTKPDINKGFKTPQSGNNRPKSTKNSENPKKGTFVNTSLAKSTKNLPSTTKNIETTNKSLKSSENNIESLKTPIKTQEKPKTKTLPKEFHSFAAYITQKSKIEETEIETVNQFEGTTIEMLKSAMKLRENTLSQEKSQLITNKKTEKMLKLQKDKEDHELEECTFKPNLTQKVVKTSLKQEKNLKKTEKKQKNSEKNSQNIENPAFQYRVPPPNRKHHSNTEVKFFNQNMLVSERYAQITPIIIPVKYKTGFDYETIRNKAKPMVDYKIQSSLE